MKLFDHHNYIRKLEHNLGLDKLSPTSRLIYAYIEEASETNIAKIDRHAFFENKSLSTIKRSIIELIDAGLIKQEKSSEDGRERLLTIV